MFNRVFEGVPAGSSLCAHWRAQDQELLDGAARVIVVHRADPWVFGGDARHFWQFASAADVQALWAMTVEQCEALLGWEDEDWDPTFFGYRWPKGLNPL